MSILVIRIITLVLLLVGTFLCGILPIIVRRCLKPCVCLNTGKCRCAARRGKVALSFLIYFGGGILLATCFVHLLPEARETFTPKPKEDTFQNHTENFTMVSSTSSPNVPGNDGDHETFPLPEFIACCGFFAVYLLEEVLHAFLGHSHLPVEVSASETHSHRPSTHGTTTTKNRRAFRSGIDDADDLTPITSANVHDYGSLQRPQGSEDKLSTATDTDSKTHFSLSGMLTVAALSFHSLFEGFAVGLQSSEIGTWTLFFAIAVHKFVLAFVLGLEVLMSGGRVCLVVVYMIIFSIMSPLGTTVAIITNLNIEESSGISVGIMNSLATGTLLYITFFEILQRDKSNQISGLAQLLATFFGFGVMVIIQLVSSLVD